MRSRRRRDHKLQATAAEAVLLKTLMQNVNASRSLAREERRRGDKKERGLNSATLGGKETSK